MSRISELNDELQAVRNQKSYLIRHGAENTDQGIVELEEKESEIFRLISEEEKRETQAAVIAEVVSPDSSFGISIGGETVDFRVVTSSEEAYQALTIAVRLKFAEYEQQNQEEIAALKASYDADIRQLELQSTNANAHNKTLEEENAELRNEIAAINLTVGNQAAALENAQKEAEAYKAQVEELRNQVSKPATPTNLDNNALSEAMRKLKESKRAIYNRVNDNGNVNFTARYADTGEELTDKLLYIGKYRELKTDAEVSQFRAELEASEATRKEELESTPEADKPVELVEDFRNDLPAPDLSDAHDGDQLAGNEPLPTSNEDTTSGSVEARLTALELAVFGQARVAA